jgi:hypothetical protein
MRKHSLEFVELEIQVHITLQTAYLSTKLSMGIQLEVPVTSAVIIAIDPWQRSLEEISFNSRLNIHIELHGVHLQDRDQQIRMENRKLPGMGQCLTNHKPLLGIQSFQQCLS